MKNLLFIAVIAAFFAGCAGKSTTENASPATATTVANKTVVLAVEGMTCTGCENTVQESVTKIAGVTEIKASHLDSTAVVTFDSTKTNLAAIGDAINEAGYVFKGVKSTFKPAGSN
jgi:mercuric ion binding protein